jgi:hypothetical protein
MHAWLFLEVYTQKETEQKKYRYQCLSLRGKLVARRQVCKRAYLSLQILSYLLGFETCIHCLFRK